MLKSVVPGKTLTFTSGTSQSFNDLIITGADLNLIVLQGSSAASWWLRNNKGSTVAVSYVDVRWSQIDDAGSSIEATGSVFSNSDIVGPDSYWIDLGAPQILRWNGADSNWTDPANWNIMPADTTPPVSLNTYDSYIVANRGTLPVLTGAITVFDLTVEIGATLDAASFGVVVNGAFSNSGVVRRTSTASINRTDTDSGTVEYYGVGGGTIQAYAGIDYFNLQITEGTWTLPAAVSIAGDLDTSGATLSPAGYGVTMTGSTADGAIDGTPAFYDLAIDKAGFSVTLSSGTLSVSNNLTVLDGTLNLNEIGRAHV